MSPTSIKELLNLGINMQVGPEFSPTSYKEFATLAVSKNVHLTIDCRQISPTSAKEIARIGGKNVTLIV